MSKSMIPRSLLSGLFAGFLLLTACSSDKCKDVNCQNGGTCDNGTCNCSNGYEGTDCSVRTIQKFIGSWAAGDVCTSGSYSYSISISASNTSVTGIVINNFGNFGVDKNINANVDGINFIVPQQVVSGITFSGMGTISVDGRTVTVTYDAMKDTTLNDHCTSTWSLK
jgi:hypothetical protein